MQNDVSSYPSLQRSGSYGQEETERSHETQGIDDTKEAVSSRHNMTDTHSTKRL